EDPRYIVSLGYYSITGGFIKVQITHLVREDAEDPRRHVALPLPRAREIIIGRIDTIRLGSSGSPLEENEEVSLEPGPESGEEEVSESPESLPGEGGAAEDFPGGAGGESLEREEGVRDIPARITLSRIEFGQVMSLENCWAYGKHGGTPGDFGADREEGYPLDLAALSQEQKEKLLRTQWALFAIMGEWQGSAPSFRADYRYMAWDSGLSAADPYYQTTVGTWRLAGNDIEVKLSYYDRGRRPEGQAALPPEQLRIAIEDADWVVVGSLESIRVRPQAENLEGSGTFLHSGKISLRHYRNGVLSDGERDFWATAELVF
ncbi:MAG: hypothetical protein LBQ61_07615, partial [Spirochaetales bacterium]|nr:hypothetical protein [Spirochaetales bacterium]